MEHTTIAGFLLINKPKDITSFGVVKRLRKLLNHSIKIGHTGTLDPFATGLLIIAIDRSATKHIDRFLKLDKTYIALGKLGQLTNTLDYTGSIIETIDTPVTKKAVASAIEQLGSDYTQTPPIYAALKYKGEPLYKLAREKKLSIQELEKIAKQKQKVVKLHELKLLKFDFPFFSIKAHVSHGTYIRSLVNDIAQRAGSVATTYELERTAIGPFSVKDAVNLNDIKSSEDVKKFIQPRDSLLKKIKE